MYDLVVHLMQSFFDSPAQQENATKLDAYKCLKCLCMLQHYQFNLLETHKLRLLDGCPYTSGYIL